MKTLNKKGIGFFSMIGPAVLILTFLFMISFVVPANSIPHKTDFKDTILAVDTMNAQIPAETFYKKEEIKISIEQGKKEFAKTFGLSSSEMQKRNEANSEELLGCKIGNLELWYNEKNIEYNSLNAENTPKDETSSTDVNNMKYDTCLPQFLENFEDKFVLFLENKLEDEIKTGLNSRKISTNPEIKIGYNQTNKDITTIVKTTYTDSSDIAKINMELEYALTHTVESYPELLITLSKIIPAISDRIKTDVPQCLKEGNDELTCIKQTFIKRIREESPQLLKEYNFTINFIDINTKEYYGLKFEVIKISTEQTELNFGIILKDNIPYSLINFELNTFDGVDNVLEVMIDEPRFASDVESYVLLYSYENFFNPGYSGYNTLKQLLQENKIPVDFKKTGYFDKDNNQYFYPDIENLKGVSLMTTNNKIFIEDESDENKKKKRMKIYQIYNPETNEYELLKPNRPVYVFAFATDKNLNYYVEEIEGKTKSLVPVSKFGPMPLPVNEKVKVSGENEGKQNTIFIRIDDYQDTKFDHFDIYITLENGQISEKCTGINTCHYFDGNNRLNQAQNLAFIISSEDITAADQNLNAYIKNTEFTNNLIFDKTQKYDVYIIPVDSSGKGTVMKGRGKVEWMFNKIAETIVNGESFISMYGMEESAAEIQEPAKFKGIQLKDLQAPDLRESIIVSSNIELRNNVYFLTWEPVEDDVVKLSAMIQVDTSLGAGQATLRDIGLDGQIIADYSGITRVAVTNIVPVDSSGNQATLDKVLNGNPYFATFSK